ncbi:MAG TPA: hypothetical protein VGB18_02240, partial [Candidatus Thermoplasmatota archaeon]
ALDFVENAVEASASVVFRNVAVRDVARALSSGDQERNPLGPFLPIIGFAAVFAAAGLGLLLRTRVPVARPAVQDVPTVFGITTRRMQLAQLRLRVARAKVHVVRYRWPSHRSPLTRSPRF